MRDIIFGDLVLRWVDSGIWDVHDRFTVFVDGKPIHVPAGFLTDLASIPRFLWVILPPMGRYTPAAVLHDYLYKVQPCSKEAADEIFRDAMLCLGIDAGTVKAMYKAVKDYGHSAWGEHSAGLSVGVTTQRRSNDKARNSEVPEVRLYRGAGRDASGPASVPE